jgi:hypothetical protein
MSATYSDGNVDPVHSKPTYKAICPVCSKMVKVRDDDKTVRHSPPGKASKHKCNGSFVEIEKSKQWLRYNV